MVLQTHFANGFPRPNFCTRFRKRFCKRFCKWFCKWFCKPILQTVLQMVLQALLQKAFQDVLDEWKLGPDPVRGEVEAWAEVGVEARGCTQCALGLYVISSSHLNPELLDPVLRLPAPMPPSPHSPWSLSSVINPRALHLLAPIFPYSFAYMFVVPRPR